MSGTSSSTTSSMATKMKLRTSKAAPFLLLQPSPAMLLCWTSQPSTAASSKTKLTRPPRLPLQALKSTAPRARRPRSRLRVRPLALRLALPRVLRPRLRLIRHRRASSHRRARSRVVAVARLPLALTASSRCSVLPTRWRRLRSRLASHHDMSKATLCSEWRSSYDFQSAAL